MGGEGDINSTELLGHYPYVGRHHVTFPLMLAVYGSSMRAIMYTFIGRPW